MATRNSQPPLARWAKREQELQCLSREEIQ